MTDRYLSTINYSLILSNGAEWRLVAGDHDSEDILKRFSHAMSLRENRGPTRRSSARTISVTVNDIPKSKTIPMENGVACLLRRFWQDQEDADYWNFTCISAVFSVDASHASAMPLHSALAEYDGKGIILSGPSGSGKSTASRRFPYPWHSLCDDTTFVARSDSGEWRAHPWPTWSAFLKGGPRGRWDTSCSVPVTAIFFLNHAEDDSVELLGNGEALIRVVNASSQVSFFARKLANDHDMSRRINREWFSNLNDMTAKVSIYRLNLTLDGHFWKLIESAISERT